MPLLGLPLLLFFSLALAIVAAVRQRTHPDIDPQLGHGWYFIALCGALVLLALFFYFWRRHRNSAICLEQNEMILHAAFRARDLAFSDIAGRRRAIDARGFQIRRLLIPARRFAAPLIIPGGMKRTRRLTNGSRKSQTLIRKTPHRRPSPMLGHRPGLPTSPAR